MSKLKSKSAKKGFFLILFKDSPEYFTIRNARMVFEGPCVRFICFVPETDVYSHDEYYPLDNIHRIQREDEENPINRPLDLNIA